MREGCSLKGGESSAPPNLILISLRSKTARKGYHLSPSGCGCGRMSALDQFTLSLDSPSVLAAPRLSETLPGTQSGFSYEY